MPPSDALPVVASRPGPAPHAGTSADATVQVGRIGKAHGLRGEVTVQVHTDAPDERFVVGARFGTSPAGAADGDPRSGGAATSLVLRSVRDHNGVLLLAFDGVDDRSAAELLRGTSLFAPDRDDLAEPDAWHVSDLTGLAVLLPDGLQVGVVAAVESRPVQDLLVLRLGDGALARVPFVRQLVPVVDVKGGRVVIDPPEGLLDLGRG